MPEYTPHWIIIELDKSSFLKWTYSKHSWGVPQASLMSVHGDHLPPRPLPLPPPPPPKRPPYCCCWYTSFGWAILISHWQDNKLFNQPIHTVTLHQVMVLVLICKLTKLSFPFASLVPLTLWNFFSIIFLTGSSSLNVMKTNPLLLFVFGSIGSSMVSIWNKMTLL